MPSQTIHRIYTEKKNSRAILDLLNKTFESFTLQPTTGYYRGKSEKSIVIELVGAKAAVVRKLAARIRQMNGQRSVLILRTRGNVESIRW